MAKANRQIETIQHIYSTLFSKFGSNKEFRYDDMATILDHNPTYQSRFYALVSIGLIDKPIRGVFKLKDRTASWEEISKRVSKYMQERYIIRSAKKRKSLSSQTEMPLIIPRPSLKGLFKPSDNSKTWIENPITEEAAIAFLKNKGYKIMKPIQPQYEEI